jgi:hypothetical protein
MNNACLLVAIASISCCMLQNNSCRGKTTGSNSTPNATATPSTAIDMTIDSSNPRSTAIPTTSGNQELSGTWGGNHVTLEISDQGATLEFDCGTGSISKPILLDSEGHFDVIGTYTREGPGPVRQGKQRDARAHYSGTVIADTMTLSVRLEGSSEPLLSVSLTRGKQGKLRKCY